MRSIFFLTFFLSIPFFVTSCFDDDDDSKGYSGYMPNFSVNVPSGVADDSILKSASFSFFESMSLEEGTGQVDCTTALNNWNKAPQLPSSSSGAITHGNLTLFCSSNEGCWTTPAGLVMNFYAQSQFYDCNAREQIQQDGLTRACPLREGTSGSIGEDNLCDESEATTVQLLYAHIVRGDKEDFNRFTSWTMNPNDPSTNAVRGLLLNKYLQENDQRRTKTRVDLDKNTDGEKVVDSTLLVIDSDGNEESIQRAYFREVKDSEGNVTDNFIIARFWTGNLARVVAFKAHVKADTGISLFLKSCDATTYSTAIASTCTPADSDLKYYDSDGQPTASNGATNPGGLVNSATDAKFNSRANTLNANGTPSTPNPNTFYNVASPSAQDIADFFDPERFSPPRN
ncbi:MAG: hypothetical protein OXB88_08040 [Bacteriovoracales bacterium]|nr:hypothetical protein [Bacteriovoracales bacterium]